MLQQTTVRAVVPYFQDFTRRWPTVQALAAADEEEILAAWSGLGYYQRARRLKRCAAMVTQGWPQTEAGLRALPGVGPYSAGAIAAIAFGQRAAPVDGNIRRVIGRLFGCRDLKEIPPLAEALAPAHRCGDYTQALMDLGATVCVRKPHCEVCPLAEVCRSRGTDQPALAAKRPQRAPRCALMVYCQDDRGRVLFEKRPPRGVLAGMLVLPGSPWCPGRVVNTRHRAALEKRFGALTSRGQICHTFTHIDLVVEVCHAAAHRAVCASCDGWQGWLDPQDLEDHPVPGLTRKVLAFWERHR